MMQHILQAAIPEGMNLIGRVATEFALGVVRNELMKGVTNPTLPGDLTPEDAAGHAGCPYCAIFRHVSLCRDYLAEGGRDANPEVQRITVALAHKEVQEALKVADTLPPMPVPEIMRLVTLVTETDLLLSSPEPNTSAISDKAGGAASLAFELAKRHNVPSEEDARLQLLERRLQDLEARSLGMEHGQVIEGEAIA